MTPFSGTSMYHENDQLVGTMVYINGIPNGLGEEYFENGQLKSKGIYKNGKIDGLYEKYKPNGLLWYTTNYKDGEVNGIEEIYDENGLLSRQNFKNGKPHGKGFLKNVYPNGQLKFIENCKDGCFGGKKDGLRENYYENGQLEERTNYKNGKPHGLSEEFYENGQLKIKENYKDGKTDGLGQKFDESGSLLFDEDKLVKRQGITYEVNSTTPFTGVSVEDVVNDEGEKLNYKNSYNYKDGKREGRSYRYCENGNISGTGIWKDGKREGLSEWFDCRSGELTHEWCYKNGKNVDMFNC